MATFKKSLGQSLPSSSPSGNRSMESRPMTLAMQPDEYFTKSDRYTWYNTYKDTAYSVVDNLKQVSVNPSQINITQEENSQVIPFEIDRYYDGVDLMTMTLRIYYVNAEGKGGTTPVVNVMYSEDKIRFYWIVDNLATAVKGRIQFEIQATGVNEKGLNYKWKTRPNKDIEVLESLSYDGFVKPSDDWITQFIRDMDLKVAEAAGYADEAKTVVQDANRALEEMNNTITNVQDEITQHVKNEMAATLLLYYTKEEVDQLLKNLDFTAVLDEVQKKIDAIDGLANLKVTYSAETNTLAFYNGETLISSHVLNANPTVEWTTQFRNVVKGDIQNAVDPVSSDLTAYKSTNDTAVQKVASDLELAKTDLATNYPNKTDVTNEITSNLAPVKNQVQAVETIANSNKSNLAAVTGKLTELQGKVDGLNTTPSLSYYATYDEEHRYTLWEVEGDQETAKSSFVISGGGGGGGETSTIVKIERITKSPFVLAKEDKAIIEYTFSSIDSAGDETGEGNATWKVGNSIVATSMAIQGRNSFDISQYISVGTQKVTLSVTDAAGTLAVKTWTVQVVDVRLESSFNDKLTHPLAPVSFDFIPYGAVSKTVHFILDGHEIHTMETSNSGIPMSYDIPTQTHGAHLLEVYMTATVNGTQIETSHIKKDIIWYDELSSIPVIGCTANNISVQQYDSTNIEYVVYDPNTETPTVTLSVDGVVVSTLVLEKATQTWHFKSDKIGPHVLTIQCRDVVKTMNVNVSKLDINIEPVIANLAFDFNPSGRSNNDADRDWSDRGITMSVSRNFDWVNGGYQLDENGDQYFCVKAGTTATISHTLFADDARRNGKEFKLIFKTTNVRKSNATFLTCVHDNIGLTMNVHEAYVASSAQSLYIPYSEEDIIEFEFNINKDSDIPIVMSYEDGTPGRPMTYASDHSFTQTEAQPITVGSPDCDVWIYRMKAYNASLTSSAILTNFIADARTATEMINRYNRNQVYDENSQLTPESVAKACPNLKVIKLEAPHFTNDKKDFVKNTNIECIHTGGDPVLDNWKATNCYHSGQGTTSNEYGFAGRNMDLLMCFDGKYKNKKIAYDPNYKTILTMGDGTRYDDGTGKVTLRRTSVPTNYFNIKVNIASSENANNALLQKRYNDFLPYISLGTQKDPRVKNTMEFTNCVVFLKENDPDISTHREFQDTEWHFYALGNIGDSKKTDVTRTNDPADPKEFVVEIMDNTLPNSTFDDSPEALRALEADQFDEEGTYGFRYEMKGITTEQQQANMKIWRDFYKFVVQSSDEVFVRDLGKYMIVDSALYQYLFTERYTMIDNRAKNTFWHYGKCPDGQYRFDFWDYDNDTGLGINNSGELTMTYGKEDIDYRQDGHPESGYIFNAATSKFFRRIRKLMHKELCQMFVTCESKNCWSAEGLIKEFDDSQAEFPEELWRIDYERKYERTYRAGNPRFLETMMNGRKKYQRRQFERDQEKYMATKYFGATATADQIMFRCNTPSSAVVPPNYTLTITPYSDMYVSVMFGAVHRAQKRAKAGQAYQIECPYDHMDDTAVLIYCASKIQSIGDISACYIHDNDFSKAEKLEELIVGNSTPGYSNNFLTNLVLGHNSLLERLNIKNTPMLQESLNVSQCPNLEELYAEGSGITGVVFANGGKIKLAHVPNISSLIMKNLYYINDMQINGFDKLKSMVIENTPKVNAYQYVMQSPLLTNVRLIGIDWGTDEGIKDTSILDRLLTIAGVDNNGYNTELSVLSGKFYSPIMKQKLLEAYNKAWPDLAISYETLVTQFTVTFKNDDGTVLDVQYVDKGSSAVDPLTRPDNPIETPTKQSSISSDFTFKGWDLGLNDVFSDRIITATYSSSVRQYTVRYLSRDYVLQETVAPYGTSVPYEGEPPVYTDEESAYVFHLFKGWDKSTYVDGDKDINAVYDRFEYTDGCFEGVDISTMSPVQIYAMTKLKKEKQYVELKDSITVPMGNDFSFSDIEEKVLINEKTVFNGSNYIDTKLSLLDQDKDWTLALDYKWADSNQNNAVLAQCFKNDGSSGFKLWFSSQPRISWGTSSVYAASVQRRDMLVLRHIKGETQLHVYRGSLPSDHIDYSTLAANRGVEIPSTLVFGCSKADDGAYEDYAKGVIYWCKVWYADLGDTACKELAAWTHEKINLEMAGFRRYYLSDNSGQRSSMTFLASHLLENTMPLSSTSSNAGGWERATLNKFLNNRFYNAIPLEWKQLIKQVKIPSSIGNKSVEISTSNCYVAIPAVVELDASMEFEPYIFEGDPIDFITSNPTRLRKFYEGEAYTYFTRSPNHQYSTYYYSVTAEGDLNGYDYAISEKGVLIELSI